MFRKYLLLIAALMCIAPTVRAQKVGLVLSGGGAKGLYHIGVIQALEQNDIPIDYISGTSMGSIIAGLYAAGYSPEQMREIVLSGQVEQWVSGRIDNSYKQFYRQIGEPQSVIKLRFRLRGRQPVTRRGKQAQSPEERTLQLPSRLISSSQIDMAISELFAPASEACHGDFDSLMIPFRCLASDMNARQGVVFKRGDLGAAIRSSMSIPLAFRPMHIDSMLLYDGGLFNNFPWQTVVEDFAPDHLIGVKCTTGNTPVDDNSNLVDQALLLMMQNTDYTLPEGANILIDHAVQAGMLDFAHGAEIMQMGYDDTMARMDDILATIPVRRTQTEVAERRERFNSRKPQFAIGEYRIDGLKHAQHAFVGDRLGASEVRKAPHSFAAMRDNLYELIANDDISMDYPKFRYDSLRGNFTALFNMHTRSNFKVTIGGNVSSTAFNQAYIGAVYETLGHTAKRVSADLILGPIYNAGRFTSRTTFWLNNPLYVDIGYNFAIHNTLRGNFGNLTKVADALQIKCKENYGMVAAGYAFTRKSVLDMQINCGSSSWLTEGQDKASRLTFAAARAQVKRYSLDQPYYATKGSEIEISAIGVLGRNKYYTPTFAVADRYDIDHKNWYGARVVWHHVLNVPSAKWFMLDYCAEAVYSTVPLMNDYEASMMVLPQYNPTPHSMMLSMPEFHAAKYAAVGITPVFNIAGGVVMVRAGMHAMFRDRTLNSRQWQYAAELSVVHNSILGPVSLSLTKYGLRSTDNMYLYFNVGFLMFTPKALFY